MELVVSCAVPVNSSATSVSFDDIVSTPSLGITLEEEPEAIEVEVENFQLPLSGSRVKTQRGLKHGFGILSTPSLGITEPDSGIFQLSAAFCRGTSSHK